MSTVPASLPPTSSTPATLKATDDLYQSSESFEFNATHWLIVQVVLFVIGIFVLYKMLQVRNLQSSWQKFWLVFWSLLFSPLAGALYLFVFVPVDKALARKKK
jgi:hypothetical protein